MTSSTAIEWFELGLMSWLGLMFLIVALPMMLFGSAMTMKLYACIKNKPGWLAPPAIVFGIAWFIVITCMAIAYTLVRLQGDWQDEVNLTALVVFVILLFPLIIWSRVFRYSLGWSTLVVFIAWGLAIWDTVLFYNVKAHHHHHSEDAEAMSLWAGSLMLVLDLWLTFAFILSLALWLMNWNMDMCEQCRRIRFTAED
jgi:tryptophan-rich sensory protein